MSLYHVSPDRTLTVERRDQSGAITFFPIDLTAQRFAALLGTRTLTIDALRRITGLGYTIRERSTPCAFDVQSGATMDSLAS
jgi:hypothetical protein